MNSPEIKAFIKENSALFSNALEDNLEEISPDRLVETILIYGDMPEIIKLIQLCGIKEVAKIFLTLLIKLTEENAISTN